MSIGRFYIILLHILLVVMLVKSDFILRVKEKLGITNYGYEHYRYSLFSQKMVDKNMKKGSIVFIGDSMIEGLCTSCIVNNSINYGIGGDGTIGVINRVKEYTFLKDASAIVLEIGINDMPYLDNETIIKNYKKILNSIPKNIPIIINSIFPIDESINMFRYGHNKRIRELNNELKKLSQKSPNYNFLDIFDEFLDKNNNLSKELHIGDGIHLNEIGYDKWIRKLKEIIDDKIR